MAHLYIITRNRTSGYETKLELDKNPFLPNRELTVSVSHHRYHDVLMAIRRNEELLGSHPSYSTNDIMRDTIDDWRKSDGGFYGSTTLEH